METSVRQAMRAVKNTVMQFSDIEIKIREATSNDPWGPSSTILSEVSRATNNYEDYPKLFHQLWKRLNDTEHVMHVQKALIVVEYLLRNGAERFINDCKRRARDIAQLKKYKHYDANNQDDAKECRTRAKAVYDLLMDDAKIADERGKAARIRDVRLQGFGGGADLHVAGANELMSPADRRLTNDGNDDGNDERKKDVHKAPAAKVAAKDVDGPGSSAHSEDGEKKAKKKKKKVKTEEHSDDKDKEGEEEKNGKDEEKKEKKKKAKKKKAKEGENGAADGHAGAAFGESSGGFGGHDPFPGNSSSSHVAADPFGSSASASSVYAAMAAASGPGAAPVSNEEIFNQLARPDVIVNSRGGEVDLVTGFGGGNNAASGEDLTHVFNSSLTFGSDSKPRTPGSGPQPDQAVEVFGQTQKRSDLWESDLLNVDNIKDTETKKKNNQPKEQQMTLGMMRSIQPLGSAPPKINNSDKRSGIVPSGPQVFASPTPAAATATPIGMMATPMGMAPVAISPVSVGVYGMGMQPMTMTPMGAMGMAPMGMAANPMMHSPMAMAGGYPPAGTPLGYGAARSAAGPNSASNDIFFR